jgi:hypothetical protein
MSVENEIVKLEAELAAQKATYEKTAQQMPVFTYTEEFDTTENTCNMAHSGGGSLSYAGPERILVTLDTARGSNTLATLETQMTSDQSYIKVQRMAYAGGAQWCVVIEPNISPVDYETWRPTHFVFTVHSAVAGTLGVKMIWE